MPWIKPGDTNIPPDADNPMLRRVRIEQQRGNLQQAKALCATLLSAGPDDLQANTLMGELLSQIGNYADQRKHFSRMIEIWPDNTEVRIRLGLACLMRAELDLAVQHLQTAIEQDPGIVAAHNHLATTYFILGRIDEAIAEHRSALALDDEYAPTWCDLGRCYLSKGNHDEAISCFKKAVDTNPKITSAYLDLVLSGKYEFDASEIEQMRNMLERGVLTDTARSYLAFALGRLCERQKEFDRAFEYFDRGNRLRRKSVRFSSADERKRLDEIKQVFTAETLRTTSFGRGKNPGMFFIVGMPRSGTSLAEQILASHPEVGGAGETAILDALCDDLPGSDERAFPGNMRHMSVEDFHRLGHQYFDRLNAFKLNSRYVTDKSISNIRYVGLIQRAFPDAKFIFCRRDPFDNCVSILRSNFGGDVEFAYDQAEIAAYWNLADDLQRFWQAAMPDRIFELQYEALVTDPKETTTALLDYCGLPHDDACFRFHENKRAVRTMSASQVQQPIYRSSVGSWQRYRDHVGPLIDALANRP